MVRTQGGGSEPGEGVWELRAIPASLSAVPRPRGQGVSFKITKAREKSKYWVRLSYEIASSLSPRFSCYKVRSAGTMGTPHGGGSITVQGSRTPTSTSAGSAESKSTGQKLRPECSRNRQGQGEQA